MWKRKIFWQTLYKRVAKRLWEVSAQVFGIDANMAFLICFLGCCSLASRCRCLIILKRKREAAHTIHSNLMNESATEWNCRTTMPSDSRSSFNLLYITYYYYDWYRMWPVGAFRLIISAQAHKTSSKNIRLSDIIIAFILIPVSAFVFLFFLRFLCRLWTGETIRRRHVGGLHSTAEYCDWTHLLSLWYWPW